MARATPPADTASPVREPKPTSLEQHRRTPGLEHDPDPTLRWKGERYRPASKLAGQGALMTGGDSGFGRSVACRFTREGAGVAITRVPEERQYEDEVRGAIFWTKRSATQ